jgi:tripartite-type tricarboxylate transporter receptor subunit TctC
LLKQTVIVENRPGASGMVATDYVARGPRTITLLFATIAVTINATLMPGKGPNIERDMVQLCSSARFPTFSLFIKSNVGCERLIVLKEA